MIGPLATIFQLGYGLMLFFVGLYGIFHAPWELHTIFDLDPAAAGHASTLLSQYRFLKAVEGGFGLFCLWQRREILDGGPASVIFLAGCGFGVFARTWSWAVDGRPASMFIVFLVLEAITFALVWLHARRDRG